MGKLGGAIGGVLSSPWLAPVELGLSLLIGAPKQYGPQLTNLAVQVAQEGAPISKGWGLWRKGGIIVWASPIAQSTHTSGSRKTGEQVTYTGAGSLFLLGGAGPITRINRMWANNMVIYDYGGGSQRALTVLYNGTQTASAFTLDSDTGVWTGTNTRFYTGTLNQPVDSLLESFMGVGNTPAYIGRWGVVLENFQYGMFGNQPPNFSFELYNSRNGLDQIITDLYEMVRPPDITSDDWADNLDVSELSGISVPGFVCQSRSAAMDAVDTLKKMYSFRFIETDGVIRAALLPNRATMSTLAAKDVDWASGNNAQVPETAMQVADEKSIPYAQEIIYSDVNRDYNPGMRIGRRQTGTSVSKDTFQPMAMLKPNVAQRMADVLLSEAEQYSKTYDTSFGFPALAYAPDDVLTIPDGDGTKDIILTGLKVPLFGAVAASAAAFDPDIYDVPLGPDESASVATVLEIGDITLAIIDSNATVDDTNFDLATPGLYVAATCAADKSFSRVIFQCDLFAPTLNNDWKYGNTDERVIYVDTPAIMGTATNALPDAPDSSYLIDRDNVLTVDLIRGTLSSITETAMLSSIYANQAFIGNEIIQFANADFVGVFGGKNRYHVSTLLRGMRGTESFTGVHSIGDVFVLRPYCTFCPMSTGFGANGAIGTEIAITVSHDGNATTAMPIFEARNIWPYSPDALTYTESGGNYTLNWIRRSRLQNSFYQDGSGPPAFDPYQFIVQLIDGSGNVINGYIVTAAQTFTYDTTMQAADGLTAPFHFRVVQVSDWSIAYGYPADIITS